jgi:hypothetical protein
VGIEALDMQELVDSGAIEDRDYERWDKFQADRMTWLLMNPAKAPSVWQAIWQHQPRAAKASAQVLELKGRRSGKG